MDKVADKHDFVTVPPHFTSMTTVVSLLRPHCYHGVRKTELLWELKPAFPKIQEKEAQPQCPLSKSRRSKSHLHHTLTHTLDIQVSK